METYNNPEDAIARIEKIIENVIKAVQVSSLEICQQHRNDLIIPLLSHRFEGNLINSIKAIKISDNSSKVTMSQVGYWLNRDSGPQLIRLNKGYAIDRWAKAKGIKAGALLIKPHPFLDRALSNTLDKVPVILKRNIEQAIK